MNSGDQLSENLVDMEYLERGPQGDSERLTKTAASLKGVESENSLAVVQLLGTAVGKQRARRFSMVIKLLLISNRCMASAISRVGHTPSCGAEP